ncbi:type II toxin-antitoxin system death-on-curing family toxin [Parasphingorhabdus pacifica]
MIYLRLTELIHVAERTLGSGFEVRDHGLLESALARPRTSVFGADAYSSLEEKTAALLHSIAGNRALVDGKCAWHWPRQSRFSVSTESG